MIANIFLLILSYIFLGKEKTKLSILGSILFPIFVNLTSFYLNMLVLIKVRCF